MLVGWLNLNTRIYLHSYYILNENDYQLYLMNVYLVRIQFYCEINTIFYIVVILLVWRYVF